MRLALAVHQTKRSLRRTLQRIQFSPHTRNRPARLLPEKTPKIVCLPVFFGWTVPAQLGLATVFWTVARRKKAQGKSAPILTALSSVFAAGGTSEILFAPSVLLDLPVRNLMSIAVKQLQMLP